MSDDTTPPARRPPFRSGDPVVGGHLLRTWMTLVISLGCVLAAAALPPAVRCSRPELGWPAALLLLAALPAVLGLYQVDTLRQARLTRATWKTSTGALRTFTATWSICLPVVVAGLVVAILQTQLPDQAALVGVGVGVLGVGALARLIGDGSSDLHRAAPGHRGFGWWLARFWRRHPWVTVYLALAAVIAAWAGLSPLTC